jgi:PKD repeat protein
MPSGSLVKAILINSAMDMTSVSEGGRVGAKYPTNIEGWGRALLERALFFNGQARELIVQDVQHTSGISSDEEVNIPFTVFSNSESLQVTLAWADPAAAVNASIARINDLDLEVINSTNTFLGNVFNTTTGESVQGGTADNLNNLEQVLLKAPAPGNYIARVKGAAVPMGPQGYAIVITGDVSATGGGNQPPVAEANGPYSGKRNVPITFSSMNSTDPDGNIVSYSWDFGDGTPPSNLPNPSHIYTSTGNFTAVLTVTDNNSATDADVAVVTVTR